MEGGEFTKEEKLNFYNRNLNENNLCYIGNNEDFLASAYKQAACLIYSSLYEGFGLPILEAMKYGCLVICSKVASISEVGGDAVHYFDANSHDFLIESMMAFCIIKVIKKN